MQTVPADKLDEALKKVLQDYAQDVSMTVNDLAKAFAKKGAQAVKQASAGAYGGGRYSRGWTSTLEETRVGATAIIYNKTPGLPHLLEKGHAKRGGGRVAGRVHIAPAEEKLVEEFRKAVEKAV